jgi:TRAP transporter TAXI family solute receptor
MSAAETKPSDRTVLRMSGTTARDLHGALARLDDVDVRVVTEGGSSVTGLHNLQHGRIDVAMAMADVAYLAYAGQLDPASPRFDQLRGLAVVTLNTVHLIAAKGVKIRSIGDLKGLRVALGPSGSATALLAARTLEAYGIALTDVKSHQLSYSETADKLAKGEMDAAFMTQIPPSQPIVTATDAGSTLVDIDGPVIELLRTRYQYLKRTMIPRGIYPHQTEPVRTIGVDLLLTCRAGVDEDVVYRLLQQYFAMRPGTLLPADVERAPATPIPLHAGAARYYRQRELSR